MTGNCSTLDWVAYILLLVGGLNWGLVGLFNLDVVMWIFGSVYFIAKLIYILVGASAVYVLVKHQSSCGCCHK